MNDYEVRISDLERELFIIKEDVDAAAAERLKPLLTELALREKIQQNLISVNEE